MTGLAAVPLRAVVAFLRNLGVGADPHWYGVVTLEIEAGHVKRIIPARSILARDLTDDGEIAHTVAK